MSENNALSDAQVREVQQIAELETRRYFDHYLKDVLPRQLEALKTYADGRIQNHDDAENAHGYVERRLNRFQWVMLGVSVAGGGAGGSAALWMPKLLGAIVGGA